MKDSVKVLATGGTIAGVGRYLKARNPEVTIAVSDPGGSGLYGHYAHGEMKVEGSSITEGIDIDFWRWAEDAAGPPMAGGDGENSSTAPDPVRVRQYFPETWVWAPMWLTLLRSPGRPPAVGIDYSVSCKT